MPLELNLTDEEIQERAMLSMDESQWNQFLSAQWVEAARSGKPFTSGSAALDDLIRRTS